VSDRARILVVDDDDLVLESLRSELGTDYEVLCANRATQALNLFRQEHFDCVISDVRMPGMDGVSLLKEIGQRDPTVGRILITAYSDQAAREAALNEAGIFKVAKPWRDELEITVRRALELRQMRHKLQDNMVRFDRGLVLERRMRQAGNPREVFEAALEFITGLDQVRSAEVLLGDDDNPQRLALATPVSVFFESDLPLAEQIRPEGHESRIKRSGPIWRVEAPLWRDNNGLWRLRCFFSRLVQEELNWFEFCAERLVDAVERYVLVEQVRRQRNQEDVKHGQLITMEKMAAVGLLASGVAHEISNPAGYVRSNVGALEGYLEDIRAALDKLENILAGDQNEGAARKWAAVKKEFDLDQALEDLVEISAETREGVERIITIAANLRTFARNGSQDRKRFQVRNCLESSLTMVMYKYKSGIKLQQEHQPVPDVLGNPAEVGQVLMNLMVNAAQAMNGSGILTLRTFIEDDWVKVSIGDTGPGIPEHLLERIFEPLFTTKEAGQGTGLGLAISRDIIERHGGRIEVSSEPGQGAVFTVMLPALVEEG